MQAEDAELAWLAFCKGVSGEEATRAEAGEAQQLPYHERIPQLTSRLGSVLADSRAAPDPSGGKDLVCMLSAGSYDPAIVRGAQVVHPQPAEVRDPMGAHMLICCFE